MSNENPQQQLDQQTKTSSGSPSELAELNPQLSLADGVYQNTSTQIRQSQLSNYMQLAVNDVYDGASDLSLFSVEIEKLLLTDELRAALSPSPVNYLLSFNFDSIEHALDLTQDFGGVSHFLADKVSTLDTIKVDLGQAKFSLKRCAAFSNITTFSEELGLLSFADKSYDLIVVGPLEDLGLSKDEQVELIQTLHLALKNTGRLVINIRNRDRLNKWTSPGSESTAYSELYQNEVQTDFTESELDHALKIAGFLHWGSYASFSQSRSISHLLSKQYLSTNSHALNHFNRLGGIGNANINEYLLFKNIYHERGRVFDLATRFVIIASASATRSQQLCNNDFAHFSGTGRKPQWRATTQCVAGSKQVTKTLVHPSVHPDIEVVDSHQARIELSQNIEVQEFQTGTLLLDEWLSALLQDNPAAALKKLVREYSDWLSKFEQQEDFSSRAYDVLPFNIVVDQTDDKRNFNIIDPEWVVDAKFGANFVLFRALFWFAFENKPLLKELAKQTGLSTIGLFVLHFMETIKDPQELIELVTMEEEIQRQISMNFRNKSIEYALLQTFDGEPVAQRMQPACQVSWSDSGGIVDEHNSIFILWEASRNEQVLSHAVPSVLANKRILRIDPIASMGLFKFTSVRLLAQDNAIIWQLNTATEIAKDSKCLNISVVEGDHHQAHFTALNEDPHFLFDLDSVANLETAQTIEVTFALLHDQYYDVSLATLSKAVSEQNIALFRQIGVLDTKQAEIEYLSSKLQNTDQHRQALQAGLHEAQLAHQEHSKNLTQALEAQTERVQQLESNIIIRSILRAKRIAFRLLGR